MEDKTKKYSNSLPKDEVPGLGSLCCSISSFSISLADLLGAADEFDKRIRGPILSNCIKIEHSIDQLIEVLFFYLFSIDYEKHKINLFNEMILKTTQMSLSVKLSFLIELSANFELQHFKDGGNTKKGIAEFRLALERFNKIRNQFAHSRAEPRANSKKKNVDVFLVSGQKEQKVNKPFIDDIVKSLGVVNRVIAGYRKNFETNKAKAK